MSGPSFCRTLADGVAVVAFDLPGEPVNTFTAAVRAEFGALLDELGRDPAVRAVVFLSGKAGHFSAGADIAEFLALGSEDEAVRLARAGQALMDRVARFPKPFVVAIHGACVGGGTELALACHYRVAAEDPKTAIGQPEVRLGLIPGAGGCNRLPRLVGLRAALEMILTGRNVGAGEALRIGLVDEVVPPAILRAVAVEAAQRLASGGLHRRRGRGGLVGWFLDRSALGQALVLRRARTETLRRTHGHYPAPLAALDAVRFGLAGDLERGLPFEAERFGRLAVTDVSRRLVEVFFATTALRKDPGVPAPAPEPGAVTQIAVVGAGPVGSAIAAVAAVRAGVPVRLRDADLARVAEGMKAVAGIVGERARRRRAPRLEVERQMALVSGAADWAGFRRADLVIETAGEDLAAKQAVLREVEAVTRPGCVFASSSATIPIGRIAEGSARPEAVVGMHFLPPAQRVPLVEVVAAERTAPRTIVTAVGFARRLGKTAIVVRDRPGFYVARIVAPYLSEAGHAVAEGAPIEAIDAAMTDWGFPVGPFVLLDEIGLDTAQRAQAVLREAFGARLAPALDLGRLVADGRLGRKVGRGFFRYRDGRRAGVDPAVYGTLGVVRAAAPTTGDLAERLAFAMLNEAARALGEGVLRSPRDGDIGALFGLGFPAFRGGPFRALDGIGLARAVEILERLATIYGDRFAPAPLLADLARQGGRFHPHSS